ncbi:lipocalin-like domain-containing protein [Ulvibacter antarcticus]|uniref:Lipocalin-like protein n=1 Tax=Ulvibacter antarcticus TaxID=442714 RepID=A0A3L9Y9X7_9FLAO|nr:lipocalin family protein [Ulvibacter antarcticus]RMA57174.1 lipocalin-like protein [Ulvibacter antarcticus]
MKTLKILTLAIFTLMITSCSKSDDTVESETVIPPTTQELLQSGVWHIASKSGEITTQCLTQSYIKFVDEDTMLNEFFDTSGGICESTGLDIHQYNKIGNVININTPGDPVTLTIISITETELNIVVDESGGVVYTINFIKQ